MQMHPPTGRRGKLRLKPFWVTAVLASEINAPKNEKPIEWLLLTSVELNTDIQCHDILQWYLCRWQIEVFFYILKSGCRIEQIQLTTGDRFVPCIGLYCIIAWRILLLTHLSRNKPNLSSECLFIKAEWKFIYTYMYNKPPPKKPISLLEMITLVARLGGFLARKSDKNPGPKTIWLGMKKLHNFIEAIEFKSNNFLSDIYG